MKQPRTFLLLAVVVATLLLGVAYAAINNINFNISGTVKATPDQANFDVRFTGDYIYEGDGEVSVKVSNNGTSATLNINAGADAENFKNGRVYLEVANVGKIGARISPSSIRGMVTSFEGKEGWVSGAYLCDSTRRIVWDSIDLPWSMWGNESDATKTWILVEAYRSYPVSKDETVSFNVSFEAMPIDGYYVG